MTGPAANEHDDRGGGASSDEPRSGDHAVGGPGEPRSGSHVVAGLAVVVFLQWLGASAVIPMLPVYVRREGGSVAVAGVVMASFFVAGVVTQYPAGRLADRFGRRGVLVGGLAVYVVASAAFALPSGPGVAVALRGLQGVGAGAAEVASLALVAAVVAETHRGRAFGTIYAGATAGMAVGPLVGSVLGAAHMAVIFMGTAVASAVGIVVALRLHVPEQPPAAAPPPAPADHGVTHASASPPGAGRARRAALIGCLCAAAVFGLTSGMYDTCWTLLLDTRHAAGWQVGLSWTLFAVPFAVVTRPAGALADRRDRRPLALGGLAIAVALCAAYPFIPVVAVLVGLGALEATGVASAMPAVQSLLTHGVDPHVSGRTQGLYATTQTASTAVAAGAGGVLFSIARWAPFVTVAAACALLIVAAGLAWRRAEGRASGTVPAGPARPEGPAAPPASPTPPVVPAH